jgi:quinol monooxygenase YgiN
MEIIMTVVATLELAIKPESADVASTVIHEVLKGTRAFPGNQGVDVLVDSKNPLRVLLLERWESLEADAAYRAWRAGDGKSDLGSVLAGPPTLSVFTTADGV